ncbi:MAG TPA: ATP-binding cassette domain-containing protein [Candidatus Merdenecus merdavium]|nr:ATP-binding cassette domain-containing protein [Candidatus Merdenecus merdavium]
MSYIKVENVTKKIHKATVLEDISLEFKSGNIYGLQGINGSGKTMLMRMILGLVHPTSGTITINNQILGKDIEFPLDVGFLIENPAFLDRYSGFDNLKMLAGIKNKIQEDEIKKYLIEVGLNPHDKKKYKKYSLGMKQRLGLAAAMMEKPEILILDEPTNALDESGIEIVKRMILKQKNQGALVIISCHDRLILEELSDKIIKLEQGRVIS